MTKERKILVAVAGVACALFLGDRVLMGGTISGPQSAEAATGALAAPAAQAAALPPAEPMLAASVATTPAAPVASLAQRLEKARGVLPTDTRDVFQASDYWQAPSEPTAAAPQGPDFDPQAFAQRHPLDAVVATQGEAHAVVAGEIVRLGERRDGLTLTQVGDRWVVWSGNGRQLKIHLDPKR